MASLRSSRSRLLPARSRLIQTSAVLTTALAITATLFAQDQDPQLARRQAEMEALRQARIVQQQLRVIPPIQVQVQVQGRVQFGNGNFQSTVPADSSVYVPDSSKALEQLRLADRLESQREWLKAAEVYQEVIDQLGERVLPIPAKNAKPDEPPTQFVTVARRVEEKLSAWPAEGLTAYRDRFESTARDLVTAAINEEGAGVATESKLSGILSRYFITRAALEAGARLIDIRLEAGDFAGAADVATRLLSRHPALKPNAAEAAPAPDAPAVTRADVLLRAAMAGKWSGATSSYDAAVAELKEKYPTAHAMVATQDVVLADLAATLPAIKPAVAPTVEGYPILGGDYTRGGLTSSSARATAPVGRVSLPSFQTQASRQTPQQANLQNFRDTDDPSSAQPGSAVVVLPSAGFQRSHSTGGAATGSGELFFQDGFRVWGVSLESGIPLPGWAETYPGGAMPGVYVTPRPFFSARDHQYSVALTDDSVLAVMGFADGRQLQMPNGGMGFARNSTRLVRLDRATGKLLWESAPSGFPESAAGFRDLVLSGSPIVLGDAVYVAARGSKGNQFDDSYVLCLDHATGKFRRALYLASAPAPTQWMGNTTTTTPTVTHLAAAGGKIIAQTNLGAIACIDAATGRPDWISLYPRDLPDVQLRGRWRPRVTPAESAQRSWSFNPPIIVGRYVISLPPDAKDILVYDLTDGSEVKRFPRTLFDNPSVLLHADADSITVASDSRIQAFDWQKMPGTATEESSSQYVRWRQNLASALRGRPFITRDTVYVPTEKQLLVMDLKRGGKIVAATPTGGRAWPDNEGAANVIAVGDHVVLAGAEKVEIWTDLELANSRFQRELEASPQSPLVRIRWAEVLFGAGQEQRALGLLGEAGRLLPAPADATASPGARARLYTAAMTMADQSVRQFRDAGAGTPTPATPEKLASLRDVSLKFYDQAADAAAVPAQQVEWRRRKAALLSLPNGPTDNPATAPNYASVISLWQEILADESWRAVPVVDDTTAAEGERPAGALAYDQIASIIKTSPAAYDSFERTAAAQLATAESNPVALQKVAAQFPNSTSAPKALFTAARTLEAAGDRRTAGRILRETYFRYPNFERKPDIVEAMSRLALATPGQQQVALSRLALGARLFPNRKLSQPLTQPDGTVLTSTTFAEAADVVRTRLIAETTRTLPDFRLPDHAASEAFRKANSRKLISAIEEIPAMRLADVTAILPAIPGAERPDRIAVRFANTLELGLVSPDKGLLYRFKSPGTQTVACAFTPQSLVTWDENTLLAVDDGGTQRWKLDVSTLPSLAPTPESNAAPDIAVINAPAMGGRRGLEIRQRQIAQARAGLLPLAIVQRADDESIREVAVSGERLLVSTTAGRLACISPSDGKLVWQTRASSTLPLRVIATPDFVVARYQEGSSQKIVAFDAETGDLLWKYMVSDSSRFPINMALSPDGTVLLTLADRILGKDLFQPGSQLTFESAPDSTNPFAGLEAPGHLMTWEGLLLAVTDQGQYVRAFQISDSCSPVKYDGDINKFFATKARPGDLNVAMNVVGKQLYVSSTRAITSYDLRKGVEHWNRRPDDGNYDDVFIGKNLLLATHTPRQDGTHSVVRLSAISTAITESGNESGKLLHTPVLTDLFVSNGTTPTSFCPVDGGLFYIVQGAELRFARGTGK